MWKIAHISDLHLSKITLHPRQFLSKRWVGNINVILSRKKKFKENQLLKLPEIFQKEKIDYLFVTGDISSTSQKKEFEIAKAIFNILDKNIKTIFIPGNHDHYTKTAHIKKTFYDYFNNKKGNRELEKKFSLKKDGVEAIFLKDPWWCIALDTALATNLISSNGFFSKKIEENLLYLLKKIPHDNNIILINHFPFIEKEIKFKTLKRKKRLEEIIKKFKNIKLFLHGHTHKHRISNLTNKDMPIVIDSGSASHKNLGKWNLLKMEKEKIVISIYHWKNKKNTWEKDLKDHEKIL